MTRNSSFELLRILAQYMIIVYHIFGYWYVNLSPTQDIVPPIYTAIWLPLHIGVILFVLISGYFGIKLKLSGLLRIIANLFLYGMLFGLAYKLVQHEHIPIRFFSFVGNTMYWFMRTYLMLYLLSPLVNGFLRSIDIHGRIVLLLVLCYFSCYVGWKGFDPSLLDGKNIVNFLLIYTLGDSLRVYSDKITNIPVWIIGFAYLCLNVALVSCYSVNPSEQLFSYAFPYNSIVLLVNAILLFVLFMHLKINSNFVNKVAASMLAVYLIHGSPLIFNTLIRGAAYYFQTLTNSILLNILFVCLLGAITLFGCVVVDNLFAPFWCFVKKYH